LGSGIDAKGWNYPGKPVCCIGSKGIDNPGWPAFAGCPFFEEKTTSLEDTCFLEIVYLAG
jgi:hypothetical protein